MLLLQTAVLVAAAVVVLGTIAGFFGARHVVLDLAVHFRPHLAIAAAVIAVVAMLLFGAPAGAGLAAIAAFANIAAIRAEYRYCAPRLADGEGPTLTIGVLNVNLRNGNHAPVEQWIRQTQPDVLVVVEASAGWIEALDRLADVYPHRALNHSMFVAMIARRPWTSLDVVAGLRPRQPMLVATFDVGGTILTVIGAHPASPKGRRRMRVRDAEIAAIGQQAVAAAGPVAAGGDFNATPWSAPMRRLVRTTPLRYADLVATTWPTFLPRWLGIKIDHVMLGNGCTLVDYAVGPDVGSDHRPVLATVRCAPPAT